MLENCTKLVLRNLFCPYIMTLFVMNIYFIGLWGECQFFYIRGQEYLMRLLEKCDKTMFRKQEIKCKELFKNQSQEELLWNIQSAARIGRYCGKWPRSHDMYSTVVK